MAIVDSEVPAVTDLPLTKLSETTKTITFGWVPVTCEGYEFLAERRPGTGGRPASYTTVLLGRAT